MVLNTSPATAAPGISRPERRFLRLPDVETFTGYKKSSIYYLIGQGQFPAPCKLGKRASGWRVSDLEAWAESRKPAAA
ncbi:MAG: helix-turn-helix transcriptional regulator [Hyphomicrobiaceae bacterium]